MTNTDLTADLADIKAAIEAQTAGLVKLLGVLVSHGEMLKQLLAAVTAEPESDSPLVETLKRLIMAVQANGEALHRIEGTIARRPRP